MRALAFALCLLFAAQTAMAEIGEDGLHKQPWMPVTFKDMAEDLETAQQDGKRLAIIFEQRGCIYCAKLHEEVFSDPEVADYIKSNFMVVQMNLFGDEEVTDFDGEALSEKDVARRWGVVFTPTLMFMPDDMPDQPANVAAVSTMPGAFGKYTTLHMFQWVAQKGYQTQEHFQKYHARKLNSLPQN